MINKLFLNAPLKRQLMSFVTLLVMTAILVFAFINGRIQQRLVFQEFGASTQTQIEAVKLGLEVGLKAEDFGSISEVLRWATANENVDYIIVTDDQEEVLGSYPDTLTFDKARIESISAQVSSFNEQYLKESEWESEISGVGTIYMVFNTQQLRELEKQAFLNLATIVILLLIGAAISTYVMANNITKPLENLKAVASSISAENLEQRADEHKGSQEVRIVSTTFNAMVDTLIATQESRIREMKEFNESLEERNVQLAEEKSKATQALEDLKNTQVKLIQSEKMASLGQLVASVAHEINTPSGAINSAISEVSRDYVDILNDLIDIIDVLPQDKRLLYLKACRSIIGAEQYLSTSQIREKAKEILDRVQEINITDPRYYARLLAQIGFDKDLVYEIKELLDEENAPKIIESFHNLGMSQIHVRDIKIAIDRIIQLVKALKTYSKIDNESVSLTSLEEDLNNTLIILYNKTKRAITIEKDFDDLPKVKCYPGRLNQVWTNLIHNSIQAMKGKGKITLRLKKHDEETIRVEVEDNGPGIPSDVLPHIFDPYFTTNSKGEGTGLGLSISKDIIEAHFGEIEVETEPGKTCFTILLPILKDFVPAETEEEIIEEVTTAQISRGKESTDKELEQNNFTEKAKGTITAYIDNRSTA